LPDHSDRRSAQRTRNALPLAGPDAPSPGGGPARSSSSGSGGWQAPFVNVFRLCGVEVAGSAAPPAPAAAAAKRERRPAGAASAAAAGAAAAPPPATGAARLGYAASGRVREAMDPGIGKRVLRITGSIPAGAPPARACTRLQSTCR
jgi:hypothetical protein